MMLHVASKHSAKEAHVRRTWAWGGPKQSNPRHRGIAMLLVLIAVAIATVLSMSFLASQATTHGVAQNVQKHAQARSVAESALVAAIHYAQTDADFRTDKTHGQWVSGAAFNGGTFDLFGYDGLDTDGDNVVDDTDGDLADDTADPVTLTVIGYYDGVSHTVHAVVTPGSDISSGTVLYVVDSSGPNALEQTRIDLIESWGFEVVQIFENASQGDFDDAIADNEVDVVYLSTLIGSSVGNKLDGATVGVVTEESSTYDAMLIATGNGNYTSTDIDITDNSHYITSPFSTGTLTIMSSSSTLKHLGGTIGSGVTTLAERPSSSSASLAVLDAGDIGHDGSPAPGRRVALPWSGNSGQWNLNADGETIMRRSLIWAGVPTSSGNIYDYSTRTRGTDIWAYDGTFTARPPTSNSTPSAVLSNGEYDDIDRDDNDAHSVAASSGGQYPSMRYVIQIDEAEADVTQFVVTWIGSNQNGHPPKNDGVLLYIWNYTTGAYEQLDISADTEAEVTLTGTVNVNVGDYLGGASDNTVTLLAQSRDKKQGAHGNTLNCDYVSLAITNSITTSSGPQQIALYEFEEVTAVPVVVGQWKLDLSDVAQQSSFGYDTAYASSQSNVDKKQIATRATLASATTIRSITAYASSTKDKEIRFAIYSDSSGEPGNLLVESASTTVFKDSPAGWYTVRVPDTVLPAGTYWLAMGLDKEVSYYYTSASGSTRYNNHDTKSGFSPTWGSSTSSLTRTISIYAGNSLVANDSYGDNDGVSSGGVSDGAAGFGDGGTAFHFNGVNGLVRIPASPALNFPDDFSLSGWFKLDSNFNSSTGTTQILVSKHINNDYNMILALAGTDYNRASVPKGRMVFKIEGGSSLIGFMHYVWTTRSTWTAGQWYHFTAVLDSNYAPNNKIYINGVDDSAGTENGAGSDALNLAFNSDITIGGGSADSGQLSGNRYFKGAIDEVRLYGQVLTDSQIAELAAKTEPTPDSVPIAYDTSGYGAPLNLDVQVPSNVSWVPGGGLTIDTATRLLTPSPATKLYDALTATNEMSIEIDYTPANNTQTGPARIATYSGGASNTNFTVGQSGGAYNARLRTDTTTSNGTPSADSASVLTGGTREHLILSYNGANITLYRNGAVDTTLARTGDLNWDNTFDFILGNEAVDGYGWRGTFHRVSVYDEAFDAGQASNVYNGLPPGEGGSAGNGGVDWIEP